MNIDANANPEKKKSTKVISEYITVSEQSSNTYEIKLFEDGGIRVNKDDVEFQYVEDEDFLIIQYQGKKYVAEVLDSDQNKLTVSINGVSYSLSVETPISFKRRKIIDKNTEESKTAEVTAPMPGMIIEVLAEMGQIVKEGEGVLILEAMKMQNEIQAPCNGKVIGIKVASGAVVNKGEVLIEIEKM